MTAYIWLLACGVLGLVFSNLRKFISIRRKGSSIDYNYTLGCYLKMDWDVILSQFTALIGALFCWSLITESYPQYVKYGELIFIIVGGMGAEWLNALMSRADKDVMAKIKGYTPTADETTSSDPDTSFVGNNPPKPPKP